ncbi:hypothetical protein ILUMI_14011 [Ignelater luminosus]|uniref:Uncharacterized protein n=1 Tax=Ignelater luminosus TaxID=2038154 RepID=A0A8K0CXE0_IGNLU|nr:hypothetical protein ILUMI_14011 [Ignelater luminosus]
MELLVVQTWVKPRKSPAKRKFNKIEEKRGDAMRRLRDAIRKDPFRYEAMKDKERQRYHERINTPPDSPHSLDENMDYCLKNNNSLETPATSREDTPNSSRQSSEGKKQRRRNTYKYKSTIGTFWEFETSNIIAYSADNENSSLKTLSCCLIANDLRHDSAAIYVHLEPLMEKVKTLMPTIRHVSFLSDGPSTQYRNKKMFFLMVQHISKTLSVQLFIWHFSERRHIKVAPDGVGECLKRTTDTLVGQGRDIHNFEIFVNELNKNIRKIKIHVIDSTKIFAIDKILPEDLATFNGTMKIHECSSGESYLHYGLGFALQLLENELNISTESDLIDKTEIEAISVHSNKIQAEIKSTNNDLAVVDYILVKISPLNPRFKTEKYYIAYVDSLEKDENNISFKYGVKYI